MKGFVVFAVVVAVACGEQPPYPPSGWKPAGQRFQLPARFTNAKQQAVVPHTVYGPPSTEAPEVQTEPAYPYPPPQEPPTEYGPPPPAQPDNQYGPPPPPPQPETPEVEYGAPQQPDNQYGPPQVPDNEYGPPEQPEDGPYPPPQPGNEYGAPPVTDDQYTPEAGTGDIPVEQGASERLRQSQFIQQLPGFEPSRFVKPRQNGRLRRPVVNTSQQLRAQPPRQQPARLQSVRTQNNLQSQNLRQTGVPQQQRNFRQSTNFRNQF